MKAKWTIDKLTALYEVIQRIKTRTGCTVIDSELLLLNARKEPLFDAHADNGILRAAQRLSNATSMVEWTTDTRGRMNKYYEAVGIFPSALTEVAINKKMDLSAAAAKRGHREFGEIVKTTSLRFPSNTAVFDPKTRAIHGFQSSLRTLELEMTAMNKADQKAVEKAISA